jgi:hypothetical protein
MLANLNVGNYTVQGRRNSIALNDPLSAGFGSNGSNCLTAPVPFVVEDKRVTPTVSLSQVSNTSCDGNFDGQITVTATTASGPGAGANYNFVWISDPDNAGIAYSASNSPTNNTASPFFTSNTDLIGDSATPYVVEVTNFVTGCVNTGSIVLQRTTVPMEIVSVTATDVDLCTAPNGSGTIDDVRLDGVAGQTGLFEYEWRDGTNTVIFGYDPALMLANLNVGNYTVQGRRNSIALNDPLSAGFGSNGSNCLTAPIPFVVEDKRVTPSASLSYTSNTSCDGVNFDGSITINASTSAGPGSG